MIGAVTATTCARPCIGQQRQTCLRGTNQVQSSLLLAGGDCAAAAAALLAAAITMGVLCV